MGTWVAAGGDGGVRGRQATEREQANRGAAAERRPFESTVVYKIRLTV